MSLWDDSVGIMGQPIGIMNVHNKSNQRPQECASIALCNASKVPTAIRCYYEMGPMAYSHADNSSDHWQ